MTTGDDLRALGSAAVAFVGETSPAVTRELAGALLRNPGTLGDARTVRRWIDVLALSAGRKAAARFLETSARLAPEASAIAATALYAAAEAAEQRARDESIEVVWTGPRSGSRPLRRTEQVLSQIVEDATRRLTIASFAVFRIARIGSLLVSARSRRVEVRILLERESEFDTVAALGADVARSCELYEWPTDTRPTRPDGSPALMHLKSVVADARVLFVSSANLTQYALEGNMELGLVVRGSGAAAEVERHFDELIANGTIRRLTH